VIDPLKREVFIGDRKVHLTPIEFRLLSYLARRAGQLVPHDELIAQIWGSGIDHDIDSLRWHMHNLRQKIETDPRRPRYLLAKYGRGYVWPISPSPADSSGHDPDEG
jgi:two-component system KDP operon response regulator KdpE